VTVGDPGLLLSRLFDTSKIKKIYRLGIIPHYVDIGNPLLNKIKISKSITLDIRTSPNILIQQLAQCETVVSSAMHGLIAADSFGIPNIRMILSDKITGGDYKYNDYYSAFGIKNHKCINLNNQDFTEKDLQKMKLGYNIKREQVTAIQNALLKTFPYRIK